MQRHLGTAEAGGPRGYDAGKKINGRKRHVLVDTDNRAQSETGKGLRSYHRLRARLPLRRFCHAPRAPNCAGIMTFETDSKGR